MTKRRGVNHGRCKIGRRLSKATEISNGGPRGSRNHIGRGGVNVAAAIVVVIGIMVAPRGRFAVLIEPVRLSQFLKTKMDTRLDDTGFFSSSFASAAAGSGTIVTFGFSLFSLVPNGICHCCG